MIITILRALAVTLLLTAFPTETVSGAANEPRIVIQVSESITITQSAALVERVVIYNPPFRELIMPPEMSEQHWRDWLVPNNARNVYLSAASTEVTARYDYPLTFTQNSFSTMFMLPTLPLPPAESQLLVDYPLSLELDHHIVISVPGFAITPPAPEYRSWNGGSYLLVTPILKPTDRDTSSVSITNPSSKLHIERHYMVAHGDSLAWTAMHQTKPLAVSYQPFRPGYGDVLVHLVTISVAGVAALLLFFLTTNNHYLSVTFAYKRANIIFALFMLVSGASLLGLSIHWWRGDGELALYRVLQNMPFGAFVPSMLSALRVERLPFIGALLGAYLVSWSLAAFGRATWTRWSGIVIIIIGALYIVSFSIALLPFPELFPGQRLALTALSIIAMLGTSAVAGAFLIADAQT